MKQKDKTRFWVRVLCWVLAGMMVITSATYILYMLVGLL